MAFTLIYIIEERLFDTLCSNKVQTDKKGQYFVRNKERVRITTTCKNDDEKLLDEIKLQKNANQPTVALEGGINISSSIKPRPSVKRCLFWTPSEGSNNETDPFSSDDDVADPSFQPTCSKFDLSSDTQSRGSSKYEVQTSRKLYEKVQTKKQSDGVADPSFQPTSSKFDLSSDDDTQSRGSSDYEVQTSRKLYEKVQTKKQPDGIADPSFQPKSSKFDVSSDHDTQRRGSSKDKVQTSTNLYEKIQTKKQSDGVQTTKDPKKNCCVYCGELYSKITLHLERKHSNESEVKQFINLPKGSKERMVLIDTIRKKGNFDYCQKNDGQMISVRRTNKMNPLKGSLKACPNCKGFFSATSIRKHYKGCQPETMNGRYLLVMSRKIYNTVHSRASNILKNEVFSVLREDAVVEQIKFDDLVITYGNKMCMKYKSKHHHKMIRARLRLIGRFLLEIKKIESSVTDFRSIFDPHFYDSTIKAINVVGQLNEKDGKYRSPASAFALGTALKFNCNLLIAECIKEENHAKKKKVQDFLKLLMTDLETSINKTVTENQLEFKRQKKVCLRTNDDIKCLYEYLSKQRRYYFTACNDNCTKSNWLELAGYTLISMQLFNRRRAGEIERIFLEDFRNQEKIDETDDLFKSLSEPSKEAAKQYVRFAIRGKLARGVPVLLHKELLECVELILRNRNEIGVPTENPYIFGIPHINLHAHLNAYQLLVKYSQNCGAKNPKSLRGTGLRKHIATQCILLDLKENEVKDLANYLGHAEKVHFDHYRMPIVARDITIMSRLLEKAQGIDSEVTEEDRSEIFHNSDQEHISSHSGDEDSHTARSNNEDNTLSSRNMQTTPKKKVISRLAWITPERQAIKSVFSKHILSGTLPSMAECRKAREKFPILSRRSLPVIKTHVSNEIRRRTAISS